MVSPSTPHVGRDAFVVVKDLISSEKRINVASMSERGRSIWDLAEKAQAEVDKWPEWKRRAADMALVTRPSPEPGRTSPGPWKEAKK